MNGGSNEGKEGWNFMLARFALNLTRKFVYSRKEEVEARKKEREESGKKLRAQVRRD